MSAALIIGAGDATGGAIARAFAAEGYTACVNRRARNAEVPQSFYVDPLMYQATSAQFLGPRDPVQVVSEDYGIDLEAEVVVVTDDVPMAVTPEQLRDWAQSQQGVIPLPGLGLPCVDDDAVVVGEVAYQGVAVVVVREADETLLAYDPQVDCALVVSVEP